MTRYIAFLRAINVGGYTTFRGINTAGKMAEKYPPGN
jgi:uncharacterized protein (DUF1697 family)